MSQVRVHNFSISLDGFGTGEGLTLDAPFGHAGHRLHEWVFPTQFGRSVIFGQSGGTTGVDNAFAERLNVGSVPKSGPGQVRAAVRSLDRSRR